MYNIRSPTLTYLHLDFDGYNSKNMHRFKIWESLPALGLETLKVFEVRFPPFHDYENSENVLKVSDGPRFLQFEQGLSSFFANFLPFLMIFSACSTLKNHFGKK